MLLILLMLFQSVFADDNWADTLEQNIEAETQEETHSSQLNLSASFDAAYASEGRIAQGFSIPALRVSLFGDLREDTHYRLSLSQTREYSSALVPQILPSEAYVEREISSWLSAKFGMFPATLNPLWSLHLTESWIPESLNLHQRTLLRNDIGVETLARLFDTVDITIGYVNGNGLFGLNTNNSRAVVSSLTVNIPIGEIATRIGASGFYATQSTVRSVNFKSNWTGNVFLALDCQEFHLQGDLLMGEFQDSNRIIKPVGGALVGRIPIWENWGLYGRFDRIVGDPIENLEITTFQGGITLTNSPDLDTFLYFENRFTYPGIAENSFHARLRLIL